MRSSSLVLGLLRCPEMLSVRLSGARVRAQVSGCYSPCRRSHSRWRDTPIARAMAAWAAPSSSSGSTASRNSASATSLLRRNRSKAWRATRRCALGSSEASRGLTSRAYCARRPGPRDGTASSSGWLGAREQARGGVRRRGLGSSEEAPTWRPAEVPLCPPTEARSPREHAPEHELACSQATELDDVVSDHDASR